MPAHAERLIVTSHYNWLANELASACPIPVRADHGLDIPYYPNETLAWWCTVDHGTRLHVAGWPFDACSPGPTWQNMIPNDALQRHITTTPLHTLPTIPDHRPVFTKLAEYKHHKLPASTYQSVTHFYDTATTAGIHPNTPIQLCWRIIDYTTEFRAIITGRQLASISSYPTGATADPVLTADAASFAADVTSRIVDQPRAWVLDVGIDTDKQWTVVEANPVFSANPYTNDPGAVVAALLAATTTPPPQQFHSSRHPSQWRWVPDPTAWARAQRQPRLRATPVPTTERRRQL